MNIVFIAPPASGKGLMSSLIYEKYGYPHVSMGDLLRNVDDEEIKLKLQNGEFVNNDMVAKLLKIRLSKSDCDNGYVLDGFPRNESQIPIYEDICGNNNIIIVLDIPRETGEKRITGRRVCLNCGEVYNDLFENSKSKKEGICDKCGHELIKRSDDNLEVYEKRYDTYLNETEPIIKYFEDKGLVYHVDATRQVSEIFNEIDKIIGGYND